jgi:hypothetical protein
MKKQIISEEFKRMQVLAGLINESEANESKFTRGIAAAALAGTLACTTPSCVKDNTETIRIEHAELSSNRGSSFKPGEEINIEIPPYSNVKEYTITLKSPDKSVLIILEDELSGSNGVTETYDIPKDYKYNSIELTMEGKDKMGGKFSLKRIIPVN